MTRNRGEDEMTKRIASLTSMFLLVVGLAAFTGSALAGNGNGNGNGNGKDTAATSTASASQQPTTQAAPGTSADAKGSVDQNAGAQAGVKPTNGTAKNTTCSTGGGQGTSATCKATGTGAANASSAGKADSSKRYGNGKTAAQIANSRGAPANTTVKGPGNSQPHKVWDCRRQQWVDVHAVKSYSTASCTAAAQQPTVHAATGTTVSGGTTGGASHSSNVSHTTNATTNTHAGGVVGVTATGSAHTAQAGASQAGASQAGGVLGVTASGGSSRPAGGVLGAIESVGSGVLPFTGFTLWIVVLAAVVLVALGLTLRRQGRVTA
jgi:hypothetical protein